MPAQKYTVTTMVVEGRGLFPFDMLRYDNCVPLEPNALAGREPRTVRLRRFSANAGPATVARWNSFGWGVSEDDQ